MKKKFELGFIGFKDERIGEILLSINLMNPNSDKREVCKTAKAVRLFWELSIPIVKTMGCNKLTHNYSSDDE